MEIANVSFLKSIPDYSAGPKDELPEYAFIGRSNVGKSSLINMLCGAKGLAKTSSTPGKTQLINYFSVNSNWYMVDLPGYGYAKTSKKKRSGFATIIEDYILKRKTLSCLFVLIDIRHKPLKNDLEFLEFLGLNKVPFVIVFTKTDKLPQLKTEENVRHYKSELNKNWEELPPVFISSSENKTGRNEILDFIERTNKIWYNVN